MADYRLIHGDALEVLRGMADNSVDAIVCDPPAGINFMQKSFDSDRGGRTQWVAWLAAIMAEAMRVIKPGGHALVWALPRTSHWTACALEDAGWEIREKIYHLFGSGFPKSKSMRDIGRPELGSALKPSVEEWILVRKPLSEPSIAAQVLATGTGGLNIGASRVGWKEDDRAAYIEKAMSFKGTTGQVTNGWKNSSPMISPEEKIENSSTGRFPSHLLLSHHPSCIRRGEKRVYIAKEKRKEATRHNRGNEADGNNHIAYGRYDASTGQGYADADGRELVADWECHPACAVRQLDEQAGVRKSGARKGPNPNATKALADAYAGGWKQTGGPCDASEGAVSRFFTVFEPDPDALFVYAPKASRSDRSSNGAVNNTHPTAKSTQLGRWLSRLICPVGGTILDPFAGSGSLGVSAILEGFNWIGIDESAEYIAIARARLEWAANQRPKAEQLTLTV